MGPAPKTGRISKYYKYNIFTVTWHSLLMQSDLRPQLRDFLHNSDDHYDLAVTLTMKQQDGPTSLDQLEASKNLRHFFNRLNNRVYGNAFRRFGRKVAVISMLEKSISGRLHYHLAMKNPFPSIEICQEAIEDCWSKTRWGYHEVDVQPIYSTGWIGYITKDKRIDGWDVENTHLGR